MKCRIVLLLCCLCFAAPAFAQSVVINETDADTPGTDELEFIELYNNSAAPVALDDYVIVLFNGNGDVSYYAIDLDGFTIEAGGYFLLGNPNITGARLNFPPNTLQNGADAVALYQGKSSADFPNGTPPTTDGLVDAFVYGTSDADDADLLAALGQTTQYDENANGAKDHDSVQRSPDGSANIIIAPATPQSAPIGQATVSFAFTEVSAKEGQQVRLAVTLTGEADGDVSVDIVRLDTLNTAELDLSAPPSQTVTFPAGGLTTHHVVFTVIDDVFAEGLETAVFALRNAQGATVGDGRAFLLIEPSDVSPAPQTVLFPGVRGQALVDSLQAHYTPARTLGYDVARDTMYLHVDARDGYVVDVYTGRTARLEPGVDPSSRLFEQGINAEHVWPQSEGADAEPLRSDMHNLFPTDAVANSVRGNNPYGDVQNASDWFYRGARYAAPLPQTDAGLYSESVSSTFEPKEAFQGDGARAHMYVMAIWADRVSSSYFDQQRELLLAWHAEDPADAFEYDRTWAIARYQGAPNPFVLDSTLARRIWGAVEPEAPTPIAEARTLAGQTVTIEGILTTPDYGFNNGQFFVQDQTAGINVFSSGLGGQNAGTPFAEGQRVRITGEIGAFDDQVQIALKAYELLSENNPLPEPAVVDAAAFTADSPLQGSRVVLEQVILTADSPWPTEKIASSSGLTVYVTSASRQDTFAVRIDRDESAFDPSPRPSGYFNLAGTLSRFRSTPQLMPFFAADLVPVAGPVANEPETDFPAVFRLSAPYPNPFHTETTFALSVPEARPVRVAVYDAMGRNVAVLLDQTLPPGRHLVRWAAEGLASGTYYVRALGQTRMVVVLK